MEQGKDRKKTSNLTDIIDHSRMGLEMYQDIKDHITSYGFLTSLVFPSSIRDILNGINEVCGSFIGYVIFYRNNVASQATLFSQIGNN